MILLSAWNNLDFNTLKLDSSKRFFVHDYYTKFTITRILFFKFKDFMGILIFYFDFPNFAYTGLIVPCSPCLLMTQGTKNDINDVTSLSSLVTWHSSPGLKHENQDWLSKENWNFTMYKIRSWISWVVRNGTSDSLCDRSHKVDRENS